MKPNGSGLFLREWCTNPSHWDQVESVRVDGMWVYMYSICESPHHAHCERTQASAVSGWCQVPMSLTLILVFCVDSERGRGAGRRFFAVDSHAAPALRLVAHGSLCHPHHQNGVRRCIAALALDHRLERVCLDG
eukprot:3183054-Rhodomonas_salina.5